MTPSFTEISDNFAFLDNWEDRYRYLIELGKQLPALPEASRTEANKVKGCASQVWVETRIEAVDDTPRLVFSGDSDAHIVKGLVALILALYSGKTAGDILAIDALAAFGSLGLSAHLTPQRSNGVRSMVDRIRRDARAALDARAA